MDLVADYRRIYGPMPSDETWFGFLALVRRISKSNARRVLEMAQATRLGSPMPEEFVPEASMELHSLREVANG